jgi:peptidoglycan/xylan/chitin deacetylase (PgdA/CDA1 family)
MTEISVIIACLNGAETLAETLDSLAAQRWDRPWEVIFADNGSTDASRAIFAERAARHPEVTMRLVDASARRGKAHALNLAIREAAGRSLVFCDADDTVAPGWLAAMGRALETHDLVAARFDLTALNPDWTLAERPHDPDRLAVLPFEPFCPVAGGATLGFHRRVFQAVGGFDPGFAAQEDTDFCIRAHRAGFEIRMVPDAIYNYRFRDTPEAIYRQAYAYHRAEALLRRRHMAEPRLLAPRPWLSLASRSARLSAEWLKARALRRKRSLLERARFNRRLGTAMGSLAGSLAYRVAPRIPGGAPAAGRPLLQPLLRWLYGSTFAVATDERLMALTFDDGPDPEHTPRLLELLARHGAKATFFMVGARAARHPELVARVAAGGHEIGNHGWDHPSLPSLPSAAVAEQIERTRAVLAPHGQALMRPPYGHQDLRTHRIARRLGYRPVFWSVTGEDWRGHDAATIAEHVLDRAAPGAIVLLHDSLFAWEEAAFRDRTACFAAVETLLERLPGYRFVTVSELLRRGAARQRYWVQLPDRADMARLRMAEGGTAP